MTVPHVQATANALQTTMPTYNLKIGRGHVVSTPYWFKGEIDELEIYSDVINPSDNKRKLIEVGNKESNFIKYGTSFSDFRLINPIKELNGKNYIQDTTTPLGDGKVFKHGLDMSKTTKKVSVKGLFFLFRREME